MALVSHQPDCRPEQNTLSDPSFRFPVRRLSAGELAPGAVYREFKSGTRVTSVSLVDNYAQLSDALERSIAACSQFWQQSVFDLAANHINGNCYFGDMLRFAPGRYGHVARKIGFYPAGQGFVVFPDPGPDGSAGMGVDQETLRLIWDFALDIQEAALPADFDASRYAVTLQWLKYPNSDQELVKLYHLVGDAAGGYTRLGSKLDAYGARARGPFSKRGIRELYALLSLVPGLGRQLDRINSRFPVRPVNDIDDRHRLVGPPHYDESRYLTILTGNRDVMTTQVFANDTWFDIPVEPGVVSVLPGKLYEHELGVPASLHRYLIDRSASQHDSSPNVSMLLGVVPRAVVQDMHAPAQAG